MAILYDTGLFSVLTTGSALGVGWKVWFYDEGTTTPKDTYPTEADAIALTNPNANPVVIGADGRLPEIWLVDPDYKAVLTDDQDVVKVTRDPCISAGAVSSVAVSGGTTGLTTSGGPITGSGTITLGGTLAVTNGGTGGTTTSAARTNLGLGTAAVLDETTAAQYRANTADKVLSTDQVWSAADYVSLTDAATIAVDMSTFINATVTLAGNRTLGNPTNTKNGQSGVIEIVQDGTGSRTLAYGSNWEFAGGSAPTLSTTAGATDALYYTVRSSTRIWASLVKALA
jgi:hypothetical protein